MTLHVTPQGRLADVPLPETYAPIRLSQGIKRIYDSSSRIKPSQRAFLDTYRGRAYNQRFIVRAKR
jgi:hypothetical protein